MKKVRKIIKPIKLAVVFINGKTHVEAIFNENVNLNNIEFSTEVDEPETFKEFFDLHGLNWLNKNYKS